MKNLNEYSISFYLTREDILLSKRLARKVSRLYYYHDVRIYLFTSLLYFIISVLNTLYMMIRIILSQNFSLNVLFSTLYSILGSLLIFSIASSRWLTELMMGNVDLLILYFSPINTIFKNQVKIKESNLILSFYYNKDLVNETNYQWNNILSIHFTDYCILIINKNYDTCFIPNEAFVTIEHAVEFFRFAKKQLDCIKSIN